jgi:5'(3')-deoxyribonucleotidase
MAVSEKIRVLFDVDGVIADYAQLHVHAVIAAGVRNIPTAWRPSQWDINKELKLTKEEADRVQKLVDFPGAAKSLVPFPGAVEAVKRMAEIADVYFVTAIMPDSPTWGFDRTEWLKEKFGNELGKKFVLTDHKYLIPAAYLVDDKVDNCKTWEAWNPGGIALLWCVTGMSLEKDLINVTDWSTVERFVEIAAQRRANFLR